MGFERAMLRDRSWNSYQHVKIKDDKTEYFEVRKQTRWGTMNDEQMMFVLPVV
jgi:hypothetical protein